MIACSRSLRSRLAVAAVAGLIALGPSAPASPDATAPADGALASLRHRLELASRDEPVLVLTVARRRLRLLRHGAVLADYPVSAMERGTRRVFFDDAEPPADWATTVWTDGRLRPRRRTHREVIDVTVVDVSAPDYEPPIPPPPDEAFPAPRSFTVRFAGGLTLEVRAATPGMEENGWIRALRRRLARAVGALAAIDERLRLRLDLSAADAAALYRGLPRQVSLIVVLDDAQPSPRNLMPQPSALVSATGTAAPATTASTASAR